MSLEGAHNLSSPVSRLPEDIFLQIFSFLAPSFSQPLSESCNQTSLQWLRFSHVCRAWRGMALSFPHLWVCPPLRYPRLAKEMIIRARGCPLEIEASWSKGTSVTEQEEVLRLALEPGRNIRVLRLFGQSRLHVISYLACLSYSPFLEDLTIHMDVDGPPTTPESSLILTPHLRTISLFDCIFPLRLPQPLHHLTRISIITSPNCLDARLPIHLMLKVLEEAPYLEDVVLIDALKATHPSTSHTMSTARLSQLKSITVVNVPAISTLQLLECIDVLVDDPSNEPVVSAGRSPLRNLTVIHFPKAYEIEMSGRMFRPARAQVVPSSESRYVNLQITIRLNNLHGLEEQTTFLDQFRRVLPIEEIEVMSASGLNYWSPFASLVAPTEITIHRSVGGFINALRQFSYQQQPQRLFTRVCSIEFRQCDFRWEIEGLTFDEFSMIIERHIGMGMPLERLSFLDCQMFEESQDLLRSLPGVTLYFNSAAEVRRLNG